MSEQSKDDYKGVSELVRRNNERDTPSNLGTVPKKYETIARCVCRDGRVHGMLQYYGANRTGRWAGRLLQVQNLPQNHLEDLDLAGKVVKTGDTELVELLFGSVPNTLSEVYPDISTFCQWLC